jgi:hypothetical protein
MPQPANAIAFAAGQAPKKTGRRVVGRNDQRSTGSIEGSKACQKNGVAGHTKLRIIVPDPGEDDLFHSFSVDVENEESLAKFLRSLLQIYRAPGKEIAASMLDTKALAWAVCGTVV